jgi:HK97 family phage prohead protease
MCDNGAISGYASVFNVADGYGDVVLKGAFANSISDFKAGKRPKLLWQHDVNSPVGLIEDIREDSYGLFIKCHLLLEIPKAKEIYYLLKNKAIDGFSIGYRVRDSYFSKNNQCLTDIDLLEISIVTFPACPSAVVRDVKSQLDILQKIKEISNKIRRKING